MKNPANINYKTTNPAKTITQINGASAPFVLNYSEAYNPNWMLYLSPNPKSTAICTSAREYDTSESQAAIKIIECGVKQQFINNSDIGYLHQKPIFESTHTKINGFANGWTIAPTHIKSNYSKDYYVENKDDTIDFNVVIYFKPQSYFYIGLIISTITFMGCIVYLAYIGNRKIIYRREMAKKICSSLMWVYHSAMNVVSIIVVILALKKYI